MEDSKKQLADCKRIFYNLPDPGGLLDSEGNFILVTKAFEQLMGKKSKDLIGTNAFKSGFFEDDFKDKAFKNMKTWLSGKVVPVHDIILNVKNKKKIIAQAKNSVVSFHGKKTFLFTLRDITDQRAAEKARRFSENKFKDILLSSSDIIWEVDNKGKIIFISGKVKEILGYSEKDMIGKTPYAFMAPDEKKRTKKILHEHLTKKKNISDFECSVLTKDKKERIFLTNGVPVFDEGNNLIGYRGVEKDITEKKRIEDKFRELFRNMKSGVAVYEISKKGGNIVFNDFNKGAESIDGIKARDVIGKELLSVFPMAKELGVYAAILRVWRTGKSEYFSSHFESKTGEIIWRDNFIYRLPSNEVVAIYEDVSDKIKANKKIEENERKFRKIFEASPEAIVILDTYSRVVDSNHRITEWLGYEVDEIKGKTLLELPFLAEKSKKIVIERFTERMNNPKKNTLPYEIEFLNKNKKRTIGRVYTRTIRDEQGKRLEDLVMISNITREKQTELSREERQKQLEKMNRLMVGRELKMIELKGEIEKLKEKLRQ